MTGRIQDVLQAAGTHAARPAATAVANGTLYSCTDHNLIYRSDGATWSTWATVGGGYTDEAARDAVAAMIAAGTHSGISFAYNDGADSLSATVTSGGGGSPVVGASRTSGNITLNSATFAAADSALDLTVAASASDKLLLGVSFLASVEAKVLEARFVTRVAGANVNNIPNTTSGIGGMRAIAGQYDGLSSVIPYTVQAGDVSGGNVVIRLEVRGEDANSKTIWANGNYPLFVWAMNTSA